MKVDGLCQHLLVQEFRSSSLFVSQPLYHHVFPEWQTLWSTASTEALHSAPHCCSTCWPPLAQHTVSLSLSQPYTPGHTHTAPNKLICHSAYTIVPFLTAQLLAVCVRVCVYVCVHVHQGATNPWHSRKWFSSQRIIRFLPVLAMINFSTS